MTTNEDILAHIKTVESNITNRINTLETNLSEEVKKLVLEHIDNVKAELVQMITELGNRVKLLEERPLPPPPSADDRSANFVVYGLAESENENTTDVVQQLIVNQLQLAVDDVRITEAVRKEKHGANTCGVIIAKCTDASQKSKVMKAKKVLRDSPQHSHVGIAPDKPKWQRQHESNMRQIIKTLGHNRLYVQGNRVCTVPNNQQNAAVVGAQGQRGGVRGGGRGNGRGGPAGRRGQGRYGGRGPR